jgi:WD40 repeat protein
VLAFAETRGRLRLWDAVTGRPISGPMLGHRTDYSVFSLVAARLDGGRQVFVSMGKGGDVLVWDARTGHRVGELAVGDDSTSTMTAFGASGGRLVITTSADMDLTVSVRQVAP